MTLALRLLTALAALSMLAGLNGCEGLPPAPGPANERSLACEAVCTTADDCPMLSAKPDCVKSCVDAIRSAENGSEVCTAAIFDTLSCQAAMTCSEIEDRLFERVNDDSCRDADSKAAELCSPDELSLACEAVCTSVDDCPTTFAEPDCVEICVDGFRAAENGSEACTGAILDTLSCQAAMTCSEIENRVLGRTTDDSCRDADSKATGLCAPL